MATKRFEREQWLILVTLMIASFMGRLDGTVVNLALPQIISDFGITVSQAGWISTAYIIANAIFVPVFGKLGDMIGRKPLYLVGITGFVITSALAGLSFNLSSLIFFRILQAVTVSIDYPVALSIIAFTFRDYGQRAQAMGLWSAIFAAAQVFGPLLGGPLIDAFSWRSVFYINIPIGILGTFMAIRYIREPVIKIRGIANFDLTGTLLLGVSLGTLVLVLDQGPSWGWTSWQSLTSFAVTTVTMAAFLHTESKVKEPVVDLKFFKIRTFSAAILTSFISFIGLIGGIFLIPIFVQTYLGFSVTRTGYLFIPMAFGLVAAAQIGARLSTMVQPRYLIAGGMFWAAIMMYSFAGIDIAWNGFDIAWRLLFLASGLGIGLSPLTVAATSTVPEEEVGVASSVLALARNIAGAFGIAIFSTILTDSITSHLANIQKFSTVHTANAGTIADILRLYVIQANILSYASVFRASIWFMFLGGVAALFMRNVQTTGKIRGLPLSE